MRDERNAARTLHNSGEPEPPVVKPVTHDADRRVREVARALELEAPEVMKLVISGELDPAIRRSLSQQADLANQLC